MKQRLNLITLAVQDINRAVTFYEKGLGWKRSSVSTDDLIVFSMGGMALALYPRHLLAEDAMVEDTPTGFSGITLAYNTHSEKEVNQVLDKVEKLGAIVVKPAEKVFWGGYSGYFKDPDGHLFEVAYNPFWAMDDKGILKLPD